MAYVKKSSLTDSSSEDESTVRGGLGAGGMSNSAFSSFMAKRAASSSTSDEKEQEEPPKKKLKHESNVRSGLGAGGMSNSAYKSFMRKRAGSSSDSDEKEQEETPKKKIRLGNFSGAKSDFGLQSQSSLSSNVTNKRKSGHKEGKSEQEFGPTSSRSSVVNNVANKIMEKMGYKEGTGLGKFGQGRVEIVEMSKQRGRRGLGLHLEGLEPTAIDWDFSKEEISVHEEVEWLPECTEVVPLLTEMRTWAKEGPKKRTIDDEVQFCDPEILRNVLACKSVFDRLEGDEMRKARTRSNPFETIGKMIFQNRAAMKMANMDYVFDFMFTNPVDENGQSMVGPQELLYFADVCAGPGGFSEYVLWRKGWEAKGFGFTLRGPNDFKLDEFFAGSPETFEPHYGVNGHDGDGNIFIPENLRMFRRFVLDNTDNKGVHFVMADGGFSVEGEENIQEILSKQLYLCQFLCALYILRPGGHFVCKLFDIFTPFSVGLVYLMYRAFKNVCIHKPNTSRPANSERYIICKWRRDNIKDIHDYMYEVNSSLGKLLSVTSTTDIVEIVPMHILKEDTKFFEYIVESNNKLGKRQITNLMKIQAFAQDTNLIEKRQTDICKECLELWKVPHKARSAPQRGEPLSTFKKLMKGENVDYLGYKAVELTPEELESIKSVFDYRCMVSGIEKNNRKDRCFLLGLGRSHIFQWDGTPSCKWTKIDLLNLELPANTLLYAEQLQELKGQGRAQRKIAAIHILDALFLGGKDVRDVHFMDRMAQAEKLAKAVSKPSRPEWTPIRVKKIYRLEEVHQVFERLDMKEVKGGRQLRLCYEMEGLEEERHFLPSGLLLTKIVEEPWTIAFSRRSNRKYYFNTRTRQSHFEVQREAITGFKSCFAKRIFWPWESGIRLLENHPMDDDKVHRHTIVDFVNRQLQK